ncbi:MAG: hypothetical protein ACHQRM_06815 [Bacteroidia bacterium]
MYFRKQILLAFCMLIPVLKPLAQNQAKTFTEDPVVFIKELVDFFESAEGKDGKEYINKQFLPAWQNKIDGTKKVFMYSMCNSMLKKRLHTPEFRSFLNAVSAFVNGGQPEKNFTEWQNCLNKLINGRVTKPFVDFVVMSEGLFSTNTFYKSTTAEWRSESNDYQLFCDSVPRIVFKALTLHGYAKGDSTVIYNTSGTFFPSQGKWTGMGGRVNWKRCGLDENQVYADIKRYSITLKNPVYIADSVTFYNQIYFKGKPLLGKLTEKIVFDATEKNAAFPRFDSYSSRYTIKNLFENVDYDGGFSQAGSRFLGSGTKDNQAMVTFKRKDKKFLVSRSTGFVILKDKLLAPNASVVFYLETDHIDSICHPSIDFKYIIADKTVTIYRSDEGASQSPFTNSFHNVDMWVEQLTWKTEDPRLEIRAVPGSSTAEATFRSKTYYKKMIMDKFQGINMTSPLPPIKDFVTKANGNKREFTIAQLAAYLKQNPQDLRIEMMKFSYYGLVSFDVDNDQGVVKDKLFNYISNSLNRLDYDIIEFYSSVPPSTINASINLLNYDMTIRGVSQIQMSDSQNVVIYPKNREIILKKNRNYTFAGRVQAGKFEFFGKEFSFDYEQFKVNLNNVDSLRMTVDSKEKDQFGKAVQVRCKTVVEDINGDLLIDHPGNKSGIFSANLAQYPIFNSKKESFAYYDKKGIQKGVYGRDKFYFKLEPFSIDSLDNFSNAGLNFKGQLTSGGIFPDFKETIVLQPDYSLGFERQAPPGGFPMYGGKGKFNNTIKLSNQGLRGDGVIDYVTSTTVSKDFLFYPDSTNTLATTYTVKEVKGGKNEFPEVAASKIYMHWMPKLDVMQTYDRDSSFSMFKGQTRFHGRLDLTPKMLSGNGHIDFGNAQMDAPLMKFKQNKFDSDTANFSLKSEGFKELSFATDNVKAHIDFDNRTGDFASNGKGSIVKFPINQYICYMDNFKWFMDKETIDINSGSKKPTPKVTDIAADLNLVGPEFISVHPKQDSLRFVAPNAKYDLRKHIIAAKEVVYVNVADARIFPDSGNVTIEKEAYIRPLTNARILTNTVTKHHKLYNANINIFARKSYSGSASYDYIDETKAKQTLYFSNVQVDTTAQTFAETTVPESAKFTLSPRFDFNGKVKLLASESFLIFDGVTRIQHTCDMVNKTWFQFKAVIDPNAIMIPISRDPVDQNGKPIAVGVMSTTDSTHVYSAFVSRRKNKNDVEVLTADGFLIFDKNTGEYKVSNKEKLIERNLPGNFVSLHVNTCVLKGEGKMNLGADLGLVKIVPVGTATHYLVPDSTAFDLLMSVDFFFDDGLLDKIAEAITTKTDLPGTDFSRPVYEKGLRELIGKEKADKAIADLNLYNKIKKFPDELKTTFLFTDVKMRWNKKLRSYSSYGKIGVGNINKNQLNKLVDGHIILERKKTGDILYIYLQIEDGKWYWFKYDKNSHIMNAISSDDNWNKVIKELKSDKRETKADGQSFRFILGQPTDVKVWLRKVSAGEN